MESETPKCSGRVVYLTLKNRLGSVEHYYHFLLGFLVPLVLERKKLSKQKSLDKIFVRSCAILDQHILDLKFCDVSIIGRKLHEQSISKMHSCAEGVGSYEHVERWGYDHPAYYNYGDFFCANTLVSKYLSVDIAKYTEELSNNLDAGVPKVVLINREPANSFYNSDESEIKSAGDDRRSIQNYEDLYAAISSKYKNAISVTLETKSLAYQIALFKTADIVIAQHGAAIANLIWCGSNTKLIEIYPNGMPTSVDEMEFFLKLAECMNVQYRRVRQNESHSDVNIDLLLSAIEN